METDILVIGGGASGLTAAIYARQTAFDADVTVIEKLFRTGKKIIATGNGKCNLSNEHLSAEKYHGSVNAMEIINKTPDCRTFFTDNLGVLCAVGSEGREGGIYPRSNSSATVLNAIRLRLESLGVKEICDFEASEIIKDGNFFLVKSEKDEIKCKKIIIAAGGYAGTSFGTDGSMLRMLKKMGYTTAKACPAVAPLKVSPERLKGLKGVRVKGEISALSGGKVLRSEKGEIQFNENTISGICVFNLAYLFGEYEGRLTLRANLLPEKQENEIEDYIYSIISARGESSLEELLTGVFVKNLAVYLVKNTLKRPMTDKIKDITFKEVKKLAHAVKNLEFEVTGCSSWQNAQASCGGIHNDCITPELESRLHKGIYFCGEILDVAGDCGGYNLQWAWSSGIWAGINCAESLKGDKFDKSKQY